MSNKITSEQQASLPSNIEWIDSHGFQKYPEALKKEISSDWHEQNTSLKAEILQTSSLSLVNADVAGVTVTFGNTRRDTRTNGKRQKIYEANISHNESFSTINNSTRINLARKRRNLSNYDSELNDENANNLIVAIQQKLFENYHTVAYTIVIGTYFITFCEYLYLRLISIVFPERITYRRHCEKHENETITRNEVHYASAAVIFLCLSIFQLVCFFLLTISNKWLDVRRSFSNFISMEARLRHELAFTIKRVMFSTIFPTFVVYLMCSIVVICSIFYMVGLRDKVDHVGSQVLIYFFDGCVITYFISFPLITILFHPGILCSSKRKKLQVGRTIGQRQYATKSTTANNETGQHDQNTNVCFGLIHDQQQQSQPVDSCIADKTTNLQQILKQKNAQNTNSDENSQTQDENSRQRIEQQQCHNNNKQNIYLTSIIRPTTKQQRHKPGKNKQHKKSEIERNFVNERKRLAKQTANNYKVNRKQKLHKILGTKVSEKIAGSANNDATGVNNGSNEGMLGSPRHTAASIGAKLMPQQALSTTNLQNCLRTDRYRRLSNSGGGEIVVRPIQQQCKLQKRQEENQ